MATKCGKVPPFRDTTSVVTIIRLELGPQGRRCFSHIEAVLLCFTPNGLGGSLSGPIFFIHSLQESARLGEQQSDCSTTLYVSVDQKTVHPQDDFQSSYLQTHLLR